MSKNINFNINTLIIFAKLVECRSLSRAAEILGMPKSTVSRSISKLESDLGVKLLRKNTHQITVTDLGEKIYSHSLKILAEANDVRSLIEGSHLEPQGEIRAALPIFMGIDFATRVGSTFLQRFPKAQLDLRLVDNMVHPIKDGYDVVFGIGPLQDSTLFARKAFTLECFLCASSDFIATLGSTISVPSQLNQLPFIDFDFYGRSSKISLKKGKKSYDFSPMVRARANNFHVSKDYILRGLGFGIMPREIICSQELKLGVLVPLLPEWELESLDVFMICPFQLSLSNLINEFSRTVLEIVTENTKSIAGQ
ncbi:MAG: LysR family transcriptional regulator [Gammaproteobacteria bacterium]|nr:LysR family transcriptional regulator [Gammaproteobacteria bacterium]